MSSYSIRIGLVTDKLKGTVTGFREMLNKPGMVPKSLKVCAKLIKASKVLSNVD